MQLSKCLLHIPLVDSDRFLQKHPPTVVWHWCSFWLISWPVQPVAVGRYEIRRDLKEWCFFNFTTLWMPLNWIVLHLKIDITEPCSFLDALLDRRAWTMHFICRQIGLGPVNHRCAYVWFLEVVRKNIWLWKNRRCDLYLWWILVVTECLTVIREILRKLYIDSYRFVCNTKSLIRATNRQYWGPFLILGQR